MYRTIRARTIDRPDAIAVALSDKTRKKPPALAGLDRRLGGALDAAVRRPEFSAAVGAVTTVYPDRGAKRLFVIGLGDAGEPLRALREGGAALVKAAHAAGVSRLALHLTETLEGLSPTDAGRALGDGMAIANFTFDAFRGSGNSKNDRPGAMTLSVAPQRSVRKGFEQALKLGESVSIARTLAATPPNVANPAYLARYCRSLARKVGLKCSVIDVRRAKQLKMGGLLAVGAGGSTPPCMIVLEHKPRGAKGKPVVLVGKAVTFDTGGYSIKPAAGMVGMKYDKCGGMAVIGALHAAARTKLNSHVIGLIPAAENMIDTAAYRPSDIITFSNGVTCEVTNTDAEGRLILADALAYACRHYKPRAIIDLATLTGGVVVALGSTCAGCFCSDAKLRGKLFDAAENTGEQLWHLPLWREHREMMKSRHADIHNAAPVREAQPIQGAAFLDFFVDPKVPWAHLDIAGTASVNSDTALYAKGPTGFGVRLLARALEKGL